MKKRFLCLAGLLCLLSAAYGSDLLGYLKLGTPKPTAQTLMRAAGAMIPQPLLELYLGPTLQPLGYPEFVNLSGETGPGALLMSFNGAAISVGAVKVNPANPLPTPPNGLRAGDWILSVIDPVPKEAQAALLQSAVQYLPLLEAPVPSAVRVRIFPRIFDIVMADMLSIAPKEKIELWATLAQSIRKEIDTLEYMDIDLAVTGTAVELCYRVQAKPNTALARLFASQKASQVPQAAFVSSEGHSIGAIAQFSGADAQRIGLRLLQIAAPLYKPEALAQMRASFISLIQKYADGNGTQAMVISLGKNGRGNIQTIYDCTITIPALKASYDDMSGLLNLLTAPLADVLTISVASRTLEGTPVVLESETKTVIIQNMPTAASIEKYEALIETDPAAANAALKFEKTPQTELTLDYTAVSKQYLAQASSAEDVRALIAQIEAGKPVASSLAAAVGTELADGVFAKGAIHLPRFIQEADAAINAEAVTPIGLLLNALAGEPLAPATFEVKGKGQTLEGTLNIPLSTLGRIVGLFLPMLLQQS